MTFWRRSHHFESCLLPGFLPVEALKRSFARPSIVLVLVLVIELWPSLVKAVTLGGQTRTKAATSGFAATRS
jgi:hypothetical protein